MKPERQFYHLSKCWYGKNNLKNANYIDEVCFGLYYPGDGAVGELVMKWYELNGEIIPKLSMFDDSFDILRQLNDVVEFLAEVDGQKIRPDEFCEGLKELGFKDASEKNKR